MDILKDKDFFKLKQLCTLIPREYFESLSENDSIFHMHIPKTGGTFFGIILNN